MSENPTESSEAPKEGEDRRYSPKQKGASISAWIWRASGLRGKGLGCSRMEPGRVRVCALLIEDGRSHDVRGTALVALIQVQLRNGCHAVVHDLATACDTGLLD
jgi:hypothetical protein